MANKLNRKAHEPSWAEVILGAALSAVLGGALGILALVFKPVSVVKDEPKERAAGVTYFVEGSRDTAKAKLAAAKRKAFAQGSSGTFSIIEDELRSRPTKLRRRRKLRLVLHRRPPMARS